MTTKPLCVVVDIDGTVANNDHRQHHVQKKPKKWHLFNATMHLDTAHQDVVDLVKYLQKDFPIVFCSGRGEEEREVTEKWLREVAGFETWAALHMRGAGDHRDDSIIKSELLDIILETFQVWFALDDRQRVVEMWRARGIRCLQVAPGDF